jgi:dimethylargininase
LTHLDRAPVDVDLAFLQWKDYVEAFRAHGWLVSELEPADEHPDGVFVEDTLVIFDDLAVLTIPGAPTRVGEVASTQEGLARLVAGGLPLEVAHIEPPGRLDGGDVLKVGRVAYVGRSSRTDAAGIAQLRELIEPRGWTLREVPVTRVLHLKSAVTALPDGTIIGWPPNVDDPDIFPQFLTVPEEHGTAVVELNGDRILMSADAPRTAKLLAARGLVVTRVSLSEFEKLEGCVTCLSVRFR